MGKMGKIKWVLLKQTWLLQNTMKSGISVNTRPTLTKKENLSVEGLREALKNVNSGKATGPDGLPIETDERFFKETTA